MVHKHHPCGLLYDTLEALVRHSTHCPQTLRGESSRLLQSSLEGSNPSRPKSRSSSNGDCIGSIEAYVKPSVPHSRLSGFNEINLESHSYIASSSRVEENRCAVMISNIRKLDYMSACPLRQWGLSQ